MILYSLASGIICELLYEMVTKGLGKVKHQLLFTFSEQSLQLKTITCFKDSHIKSHSGKSLCGREASSHLCLHV